MVDRDEVAELRAQVEALLARVTDLEQQALAPVGATQPSAAPLVVADVPPETPATHANDSLDSLDAIDAIDSSRRRLLRSVGVAAAGAVGGAAVLGVATASPAAAADGATMKVGESHSGSGSNSVTALNNSSFRSTGGPTSALYGIQDKVGIPAITGFGQGEFGDGVRGFASDTGSGVSGESAKGNGVTGETTVASKAGVSGITSTAGAYGLVGHSTNGAALRLVPGPSMPPFTGTWTQGSLVVNNGDLWFCTASGVGEVSKWARLSSTFTALAASKRIYDSRPGTLPAVGTKTRFADHTTRVIDAKTGGAILPGASAVMLNVVATETNAGGYFSFWRNGMAWPGTSSINWNRLDTTIANSVVVSLDSNGLFQTRMEGVGGAHLVVDVVGFYL